VKTATASLAVSVPARAIPKSRSAHIVSVGVNDYLAASLDLNYAAPDAELFAEVLQASLQETGGWEAIHRSILTAPTGSAGRGASKQEVLRSITQLGRAGAAPASADDLVFIFFAGHGVNDAAGDFFLLPSDFSASSFDKAGQWRESAISGDELARALEDIDAREIVLVIDACFSESSVADGRFKPAPLGDRGLGQVAYDKGMRILVSARANEAAIESGTIGHGLVTYALMHFGLRQARADRLPADGEVTLIEWLAYVQYISNDQFEGVIDEGWRFQATRRGFVIEPSEDEVFGELQRPRLFDFAARLGLPDETIGLVPLPSGVDR
jgi:uncharacterized caspase-like protein